MYTPDIAPPAPATQHVKIPVTWERGALVRAPNWLGDTLICMPAVHALRTLMPESCELGVVCPASLAPVWRAAAWVDQVIPMNKKRVTGTAARMARAFRANVALVLPNSFGSALDLTFKGIPVRIGRGGRGRGLLLTHRSSPWHPADREATFHQISHYYDLVQMLGTVRRLPAMPALTIMNADQQAADAGLENPAGRQLLALAPGAAYGPAKQWPVQRFAHVADKWEAQGGQVVVLGTSREQELGATICEGRNHCQNLCGTTTLEQLMAVLSRSTACVANDSGTMHLAAALGVKGVAIFGSTNAQATGPLGAPWILFTAKLPCSPCFDRTCQRRPQHDYACLKQTDADDVFHALMTLRC